MNTRFTEKEIQIAHKHMKGCSTSLIIRKMQIKGTWGDHFSAIRLAKLQKSDTPRVGKTSGQEVFLYLVGGSENWHNPMEDNSAKSIKLTNAHTLGCNSPDLWRCSLQIFLLKYEMTWPRVMFTTEVYYKGSCWSCSILGPQLLEPSPEHS